MSLLFDAWLVLRQDAAPLIAFCACMLLGGALVLGLARWATVDGIDAVDQLSLAAGGWIVPILPAALLVLGVRALGQGPAALLIALLLLITACALLWMQKRRHAAPLRSLGPWLWILGGIWLALIPLRLAFVARLQLPLYFDSPEHYQIIANLLRQFAPGGLGQHLTWPVTDYYHLGYHAVLAALTAISSLSLAQMMLVAGQLVLAAAAVPLFVIVRNATGSSVAGLLAVIFGALGWYMPAHAVNWGKYPALFSLPVMLFALGAAHLYAMQTSSLSRFRWLILASAGVAAAFLIHTRSIIVLALVFCAWGLASWSSGRGLHLRIATLAIGCLALAGETWLIARSAVLAPVLDPYLGSGIWPTAAVIMLAAPAYSAHPRLAMTSLLALVFLLAGLFVPAPDPSYATLLDRPLVEMLLFVPLSVLGAAGFAGLFQNLKPRWELAGPAAAAVVALAVILHALLSYEFHPSACCAIATQDDLAALTWIDGHLAQDARVLIASAEVRYADAPYPPLNAAADAGAWVTPLTGRLVYSLSNLTDFATSSTRNVLCAEGISDVFVGAAPQAFNSASLDARPDWYILAVGVGRARVYDVAGCDR